MKLNVNTFSEDKVSSTQDIQKTVQFGLGKDAKKMMFGIFTKGLYSNPIGTVVREISSNCYDSHAEAKVDDAVVIEKTKENNQYYLNFKDVGVGMSYERVTQVFSEYFNSTKRDTNDQIGGFGIGGKTPLAYAESFYIITVFDKVKYIWCVYKGEESPMIDLMSMDDSEERNGTTIKIPVKESDLSSFEYEMVRQLYYFENLVFVGFSDYVRNDYTIYRGKNFIYRGQDYSSRIHICLGRVAYPIDYSALGLNEGEYNVPIALKFDIGDIEVTPSRETVQYTESTIKMIKKKLEIARKELSDMLLHQYRSISSLSEYYDVKAQFGNLILNKEKDLTIRLGNLVKSDQLIYPKFNALRLPDADTLLKRYIDINVVGKRKKKNEDDEQFWNYSPLSMDKWKNKIYYITNDEKKQKRTQSWLKTLHPDRYFFVNLHKHLTEENFAKFEAIQLAKDGKHAEALKTIDRDVYSDFVDLKRTFQPTGVGDSPELFAQLRALMFEVIDLVKSKSTQYKDVVVPDDFTILRRNEFSAAMLDRKINVMWFRSHYKAKRVTTTFRDMLNFKGTFIYGSLENSYELKNAAQVIDELDIAKQNDKANFQGSRYTLQVVAVNKTTMALMHHLKNVVLYTELYPKYVMKKRADIISVLEKQAFLERYGKLNTLFFNKALTSLDRKLKTHTDVLSKAERSAQSAKHKHFSHVNMAKMNIDTKSFKSGHDKSFNYIEEQTKKNEMIQYVNIPRYTDVEKNPTLKQLIDLVYVK